MENRRQTRGRTNRGSDVSPFKSSSVVATTGPSKRNALTTTPSITQQPQQRNSPVRRSSRPRSTTFGQSATTSAIRTANVPSPIKETKETKSVNSSKKDRQTVLDRSNKITPVAPTTTTYSSSTRTRTEKTIEIRGGDSGNLNADISKIGDYLTRSVSKSIDVVTRATHTPTTNRSDAGSHFSRSLSRSIYEEDRYSKAEFSDKDDDDDGIDVEEDDDHFKSFTSPMQQQQKRNTPLLCRKFEVPREFGGWLGATLLMLVVPFLVYYLQWSCTKSLSSGGGCIFKTVNVSAIFDVKYLSRRIFQRDAVAAFVSYHFGVFFLSSVLFGRRVQLASTESRTTDSPAISYKFNALPIALVVSVSAGIAQCYFKYSVADFILRNYLRFCIYGLVHAFITALWCFFRGNILKHKLGACQWNTYGRSGNFLVDYALGRQVNPKWFGIIEFKQVYYRASLIATMLFAECFLFKIIQLPMLPIGKEGLWNILQFYSRNIKYDTAALVAATLLLIYIWDAIIFEHHLASSFELQAEGFGCLLLLRYAVTPYLLSAVAKYFYDRQIPISCKYAIYVSIVLLLTGLVVKRLSSAIKYKYRINPTNPLFAKTETIHTFQGKRLLLGSFWGSVRHPNYAGDILALIGLSLPLWLRFAWPPAIGILMCIALLLHRCQRVHTRNTARYHSSWGRYCVAVPYNIIPKVF